MTPSERGSFIKYLQSLRTSPQTLRGKLARESKAKEVKKGREAEPSKPVDISEYLNL